MTVTLERQLDRSADPRPALPALGADRRTAVPAGSGSWTALGRRDIVDIVRHGALVFTALVVAFAGFFWVGSGLQEGRHQTGLQRSFRAQLATLEAPVGGAIAEGVPVARLEVPGAGINQIVSQGTTSSELRSGPGHLPASVMPGQIGNAVVLGRRLSYDGPFRRLGDLRPGDKIAVTTGQGVSRYKVVRVGSRSGRDGSAFLSTTTARLTLVTSSSALVASRYTVVVAELTSKPFASTGRTGSIRRNELGLTGDSGTAPALFLWLVAFAFAALVVTWGSRARPGVVAWLLSVPVLLALVWLVFDSAAPLLPALL